jgi:ribosomal protein L40E
MICLKCNTTNPEDAKFCMGCGSALALACPNCAAELPSEAAFCFVCGHKMGAPLEAPPAETACIEQYIPAELLAKLTSARTSGGMEGERRVVTMLFCDVKGSTAKAEQLDPEEWAEIMNGAFEHLISPVYAYEGTLARLMGDAILAFFGAPIAHEDDPQRAVLAGLDILRSIEPYKKKMQEEWGFDFDVRVGINTVRLPRHATQRRRERAHAMRPYRGMGSGRTRCVPTGDGTRSPRGSGWGTP